MQAVIIAVVITFIVTCAITWFVANAYQKKQTASKIGSAEDKAREIIDEAVKTAETYEERIGQGNQGKKKRNSEKRAQSGTEGIQSG